MRRAMLWGALVITLVGCGTAGGGPAAVPQAGAVAGAPVPSQEPSPPVGNGLIAWTLRDSAGLLQVFTAWEDGTDKRQLTFSGNNGRPAWSPDGKRIAFMAMRPEAQGPLVMVMDADGSNQHFLATGMTPDWSRDGRRLAFARDGQIWTMNSDGTQPTQVSFGPSFKAGPSWSPDGRQMVFIMVQNPSSPDDPRPTIGIMNADGTGESILTPPNRINVDLHTGDTLETAYDANAPAWSPMDDRVAFWSGIENRYGQVWTVRADGSDPTQLTDDPSHRNSDDPSWSPDGRKILFSSGRSGSNLVYLMNADGTGQRALFPIDVNPFPGRASWQPVPAR